MAELKLPDPTVWVEFELDSKMIDPPRLRLEVKPFTKAERTKFGLDLMEGAKPDADMTAADIWEMFKRFVPLVVERIVGWDLTQGGVPLPCNAEMKGLIFNQEEGKDSLLWENVVPEAKPEGYDPGEEEEEKVGLPYLWSKVMNVIGDRGSVLKN